MNHQIIAAAWIVVGGLTMNNPQTNPAGAIIIFGIILLITLGALI